MSTFAQMFERCTPLLMQQFGERDEFGDAKTLLYFDPTQPAGSPPHTLAYIMSEITLQPVADGESMELSVKEAMQADVPTADMVSVGIERIQPNAIVSVDGQEWSVDEATSEWSPEFVTLGLVREPLLRKNECRAAV